MELSRRNFIRFGTQLGVAASASMLWANSANAMAFEGLTSEYKALVLVSMTGGNDCNSFLVPGRASDYAALKAQRSAVALDYSAYQQIYDSDAGLTYGLHPSMKNVASMYAQKRACVIANIGSLPRLATKSEVLASKDEFPGMSFSHSIGVQQWQTAQTSATNTGWGGRMGDYFADRSGSVSPLLSADGRVLFTVGSNVQAVSLQAGGSFVALPADLSDLLLKNASLNSSSTNDYVRQAAGLRRQSMEAQAALTAASSQTTFRTPFPGTAFGAGLRSVAQIVGGRNSLQASRQIFYISQGNYDTHQYQTQLQANALTELDDGLGALFAALDEIGMSNQVLVCTHSDFGRSLQANNNLGTDHGWGGHQLLLGGGINGGRILGKLPQLVIGGPDDVSGNGAWIPTLGVPQMTAAIAGWMGLTALQTSSIFPELSRFPTGALRLT